MQRACSCACRAHEPRMPCTRSARAARMHAQRSWTLPPSRKVSYNTRSPANLLTWGRGLRHMGCSLRHMGCSLRHMGCSLRHMGCILRHMGCSLCHMGCSLRHMGSQPPPRGVAAWVHRGSMGLTYSCVFAEGRGAKRVPSHVLRALSVAHLEGRSERQVEGRVEGQGEGQVERSQRLCRRRRGAPGRTAGPHAAVALLWSAGGLPCASARAPHAAAGQS